MAVNNIVVEVSRKSIFNSAKAVIDATISYEQGDLLYFDDTNNLIKKPAAETDGVTFLGVATETVVLGKLKKPFVTDVDASSAITDVPGPAYGVVARLVAKTGVAFAPGDLVYLDLATGTRGVTTTGTKAIGIYQGATIASAAAGQEVECLIGTRFGGDVLKF